MHLRWRLLTALAIAYAVLVALHAPLLRLPYFWDEAGYYVPAALDFYRYGLLIPGHTLTNGHTPLVPVYLGTMWHLFGFSPPVTRAAMIFFAAGTLVTLWALARRVTVAAGSLPLASNSALKRTPQRPLEIAAWAVVLLALSPLFFAQSTLAHLDLAVALFTTLALVALLDRRWAVFAFAAAASIASKETAVIILPVAWAFAWRDCRAGRRFAWCGWLWLTSPLLVAAAWALYYHHVTGFWTGNSEYLQYNLYSTLNPMRILLSLLRRLYEVFLGGFHWLLVAGAAAGYWRTKGRRQKAAGSEPLAEDGDAEGSRAFRDFAFLTVGLTLVYLALLSTVGGAILPRYLLPIFPPLFLAAVILVWRLPGKLARGISLAAAACLVSAWFINPPSPFPYEDNLAYASFIKLHREAAACLATQPTQPRILTAWPATDELVQPSLGYVTRPLRVVRLAGFEADDFAPVQADSFDLLYLYSRKWEPPQNLMNRSPGLRRLVKRYFDYSTQVPDAALVERFHLRLLAQFARRGQWVRIYARQ